jgi:hypothetical protein
VRASFLWICLALVGCKDLGLPSPPPPPGPASISGRVVDPANTLSGALEGVQVSLEGTSLRAVTDADGLFRLSPVIPGRSALSLELDAQSDGRSARGLRRTVQVAEGQQLFLGDLPLRGTGEIQGRVTLAGAMRGNAGTLVYLAGTQYQALTGDDGAFRLPELPEGTFSLGALADGYEPKQVTVEVLSGQVTQARPMDLTRAPPKPCRVEGVLEFVGAAEGAQAHLAIYAAGAAQPTAELDSAAGTFEVSSVTPGLYRLQISGTGLRSLQLDGLAAVTGSLSLGVLRVYAALENDLDGDGLTDDVDPDVDGDGTANGDDRFPRDAREHLDTDGDGLGNDTDLDDDDDGLLDAEEISLGTDGVLTDPLLPDTDGDGVRDLPDVCRAVPDPAQTDTDGDGRGDACDGDVDGDGVPTERDNCPAVANANQRDLDADGEGDVCDADLDGDGAVNLADNCREMPNADQADLDADQQGDVCDPDLDGDGVSNTLDDCPRDADPTQSDLDRDRLGDACDLDRDGDGVTNTLDTCPVDFNPLQDDLDGDRAGDVCDPDLDGDTVANASDNCPRTWNQDQADDNVDGIGNLCDPTWVPPTSVLPAITSFAPTAGNPNDPVVITGRNFEPTASLNQVDFNGAPATVTAATPTELTVRVPASATSGIIRVRTRSGSAQSSTTFVLVRPPVISDAQPRTVAVGQTLTIYGSDFDPDVLGNVVQLGATTLTVKTASPLVLTAQIPAGTTEGTVKVTKFGAPTAVSSFTVSIMPSPTISNVTPNGSVIGGRVAIYGTGFGPTLADTRVTFNGVTATLSSVTSTQINALVPAGATTGPLVVTSLSGQVTWGPFTVDQLYPIITGETGATVFMRDAGASDTERTYSITGNNLAPVGSIRLANGALVPALDGGTTLGAQFVLPEPWVSGGLVYVRGDGAEVPLSGQLRTGQFIGSQALSPVPELWVSRGDRARYYGTVGKLIYQYDGATLQPTADPPFDDGSAPTFLEVTTNGGFYRSSNGVMNTTTRSRSGVQVPNGNIVIPAIAGGDVFYSTQHTYYGVVTYMQRVNWDMATNTQGAQQQVSSLYNYTFNYSGPNFQNPANGKSYFLFKSSISSTWNAMAFSPTNAWATGSFSTTPSAGYWSNDDDSDGGGAGGTLYMGRGWSVTLPETAQFMAALPNQRAAVVLGATKLMIVDLNRRTVSSSPLTVSGTVKGLYKEWDRDELVIRTDSPTQTLTRLTIDP